MGEVQRFGLYVLYFLRKASKNLLDSETRLFLPEAPLWLVGLVGPAVPRTTSLI